MNEYSFMDFVSSHSNFYEQKLMQNSDILGGSFFDSFSDIVGSDKNFSQRNRAE